MRRDEHGQVAAGILAGLVAIILIVGIVVAGYQLNWWLKGNAVNRTAKINRQSYEVQQTYHEKVLQDISDVRRLDAQIAAPAYASQASELRAERIAAVGVACDHISRLTTSGAGLDPDIQQFHDQECAL